MKTFKQQLETALQEPSPPPELVENTIQRCQAVTRGRLAEEQLASTAARPPAEQRGLVADALLGHLSFQMKLPHGLNREWLLKQDAFCKAADAPASKVLKELRQGTLLRRMTQSMKPTSAPLSAGRTKTNSPNLKK